MRRQFIALVAAIVLGTLGGSAIANAQTANRTPRNILGFQDSRTGIFHPLGSAVDLSADTTATTTYTGTIEATITITLKTALPKGGAIVCSVGAIASSESETDPLEDVVYDESATSLATVSGSTATCKVSIPFSWLLITPASTVLNTLQGSLDVTMFSTTTTTITEILEDTVREHSQALAINSGKVADGTLTVSAAVTL